MLPHSDKLNLRSSFLQKESPSPCSPQTLISLVCRTSSSSDIIRRNYPVPLPVANEGWQASPCSPLPGCMWRSETGKCCLDLTLWSFPHLHPPARCNFSAVVPCPRGSPPRAWRLQMLLWLLQLGVMGACGGPGLWDPVGGSQRGVPSFPPAPPWGARAGLWPTAEGCGSADWEGWRDAVQLFFRWCITSKLFKERKTCCKRTITPGVIN